MEHYRLSGEAPIPLFSRGGKPCPRPRMRFCKHWRQTISPPSKSVPRRVIESQPNYSPAWHALGAAALRKGRTEEAIESLNRAVSLGGDGASLRFELASALEKAGRWEEAVAHLRHATVLDPQCGEAHVNLAALLEKMDHLDEALQIGRRAIELRPKSAAAYFNLAAVLRSRGELAEAIAAFSKSIDLDNNFAVAIADRGCCRLLQGDYAVGWADYEHRLQSGKVEVNAYPQPRWNGEPLGDGTLLVHGEQGIGDEILFASCLPELVMKVAKVALVCDPRLARLMARSFPAITVVGHARQPGGAAPQLPFPIAAQIPAGSLSKYLRPSAASFPDRKRFLIADPAQRRTWRYRFASLGTGLKVGISWRGGGTWEERRRRTTTLDQWREILSIAGVQFINLQYGDCAAELDATGRQFGVTIHRFTEVDPLGELDALAAQIAALDLVISIGNANVHLAGALGVPTWCLLPMVPQWRWGLRGDTTPWYPSVQLIRQRQLGNWAGPIGEAARRLCELIAPNSRSHSEAAPPLAPIVAKIKQPKSKSIAPSLADPAATLKQAIELFNQSRFEDAAPLAEQILAADPNSVHALRILGVAARGRSSSIERSTISIAR